MFFLALDRCKRGGGGFFLVLVFRIHSIVVVVVVVSWMFVCWVKKKREKECVFFAKQSKPQKPNKSL